MPNVTLSAGGYRATQPAHVQIRATIDTMNTLKGGKDIRNYSGTARKELLHGGTVEVIGKNGETLIGEAPKLALVVVSTVFRDYFEQNPTASSVKVAYEFVGEDAVAKVLTWVNTIVRATGKFGINIPDSNVDLIMVRYAAQALGMDLYVSHFVKAYKDDLRLRTPPKEECALLAHSTVYKQDDLVNDLGGRITYLRRTRAFDKNGLAFLNEFLKANEKIGAAVQEADARAKAKRAGGGPQA